MGKRVFIAEKPSVAKDIAKALHENFTNRDGYQESENTIVTWCFGHLVTMSYPEAYDPKYKKWSLDTIPFIPEEYRYQVIDDAGVKKQFKTVKSILTSEQVDTIYICTDSGREGEYIYRLVAGQAGVKNKRQLRVWIDSFTEAEIQRGIREAKDDSAYDNMGAAAYLRAKEDYLMGINFSRALSLKYSGGIRDFLGMDRCVIAVGRVMTCVLGIVVRREREIRSFVKTPFYRVVGSFGVQGDSADSLVMPGGSDGSFEAEWSAKEGSRYYESPLLYKENGFRKAEDAAKLIEYLQSDEDGSPAPLVKSITHKQEKKNPPLLYNLAELQNDCSRFFKLSPDQTLDAAQTLYERKLTTYPRTDARVLSTAVSKEIDHNLKGIGSLPQYRELVRPIAETGSWKSIGKTRYTNDKAITDHYAIIPTGEGFSALKSLNPTLQKVYDLIVRRFLSVFYPAAVFDKMTLQVGIKKETLTASLRVNREKGYLVCVQRGQEDTASGKNNVQPSQFSGSQMIMNDSGSSENGNGVEDGAPSDGSATGSANLEELIKKLKKGDPLTALGYEQKEGETSPPKRYTGGSMILTMENAGQFIEDDELREQIKGSGIGTSATRAGILEKLVNNQYLNLNAKTQVYTPTQLGEMIYDTVYISLKPLLEPKLTASWEKGLTQVAEGETTEAEYQAKLNDYVTRRTNAVKNSDYRGILQQQYRSCAQYYPKAMHFKSKYSFGKKTARAAGTANSKTNGAAATKDTSKTQKTARRKSAEAES